MPPSPTSSALLPASCRVVIPLPVPRGLAAAQARARPWRSTAAPSSANSASGTPCTPAAVVMTSDVRASPVRCTNPPIPALVPCTQRSRGQFAGHLAGCLPVEVEAHVRARPQLRPPGQVRGGQVARHAGVIGREARHGQQAGLVDEREPLSAAAIRAACSASRGVAIRTVTACRPRTCCHPPLTRLRGVIVDSQRLSQRSRYSSRAAGQRLVRGMPRRRRRAWPADLR